MRLKAKNRDWVRREKGIRWELDSLSRREERVHETVVNMQDPLVIMCVCVCVCVCLCEVQRI